MFCKQCLFILIHNKHIGHPSNSVPVTDLQTTKSTAQGSRRPDGLRIICNLGPESGELLTFSGASPLLSRKSHVVDLNPVSRTYITVSSLEYFEASSYFFSTYTIDDPRLTLSLLSHQSLRRQLSSRAPISLASGKRSTAPGLGESNGVTSLPSTRAFAAVLKG